MDDNSTKDAKGAPSMIKRRDFLKYSIAAVSGAALFSSLPPGLRTAAWAAGSDSLETTKAKLGFIALTDAAPLFVADEKGFFAKHGMTDVEVLKQSSWGTTRDNLVLGSARNGIDGAHILTPMPYLITTGAMTANNIPTPMYILARLNLGGQCISVGQEYAELKLGVDSTPFKAALEAKKATGKSVSAAMTFPGGTHDLWMRYWLAAGGIDPNSDISTIVVPPAQMVANMKVGSMDTFCVCEPWNEQLINQKIGYTALTTSELWHNHPEKALGMRADWVDANPNAAQALLKAVMEAQMFCEDPANREEVAKICSKRRWINAPFDDVVERMKGNFDYGNGKVVENSDQQMRYWKDHASYPYKSHDKWFITEDIRWGYLPQDLDMDALVDQVNREDLWRAAATSLGVPAAQIPTSTSRGIETFFDGKTFDPENPKAYLDSLAIKAMS
ncbi:CmpA/NrtA family ABC transporter substrate-binding protein [Halopseudomonas pelagia]|uniref:CmpA/NrtA family ABC transporter substrate-binding protein n=1 Tax=Halopseudomonas pelagia TaxID=553151 RepID=UPI0003AB4152|nr:CmpA/NrtA family ABC transporter substrate-binding protein [Halopseudomonas pelagia]|tara:strand:- start:367 stop:1701 length:1335 start_codon:yes stop_codon:yes gene_type:complete